MRGRNGGGHWYFTDGELTIGVLAPANVVRTAPPAPAPHPEPRVRVPFLETSGR